MFSFVSKSVLILYFYAQTTLHSLGILVIKTCIFVFWNIRLAIFWTLTLDNLPMVSPEMATISYRLNLNVLEWSSTYQHSEVNLVSKDKQMQLCIAVNIECKNHVTQHTKVNIHYLGVTASVWLRSMSSGSFSSCWQGCTTPSYACMALYCLYTVILCITKHSKAYKHIAQLCITLHIEVSPVMATITYNKALIVWIW